MRLGITVLGGIAIVVGLLFLGGWLLGGKKERLVEYKNESGRVVYKIVNNSEAFEQNQKSAEGVEGAEDVEDVEEIKIPRWGKLLAWLILFFGTVGCIHAMAWVHKATGGKFHLFLFSLEDGKAAAIWAVDRIISIKITLYGYRMRKDGEVVYYDPNWIIKPFYWLRHYLFGSIHFLGIPLIHRTSQEEYKWKHFDPLTNEIKTETGKRGYIPLREYAPLFEFKDLDIGEGGQINVQAAILIKVVNPRKALTNARDWFAVLNDLMQSGAKEFFSPRTIEEVFTSKSKTGEKIEKMLSVIMYDYMSQTDAMPSAKDIMLSMGEISQEERSGKITLLLFLEKHYGIRLISTNVKSVDAANKSTEELLNSLSKPAKTQQEANALLIMADAEAEAFNKKRKAMEAPGGRLLRTLEAIENSRLITLGGKGEDINFLVGQGFEGAGGKEQKERKSKEKKKNETREEEEE